MTNENIVSVVDKFHKEISGTYQFELKNKLKDVPDEKYDELMAAKVKKPIIAIFLSTVLGLLGAASFYLGYVKRGLFRLIFCFIIPFTLSVVFLCWLAPQKISYSKQSYEIYQSLSSDPTFRKTLDSANSSYKSFSESYNSFTNIVTQLDYNEKTTDAFSALTSVRQSVSDIHDSLSKMQIQIAEFLGYKAYFSTIYDDVTVAYPKVITESLNKNLLSICGNLDNISSLTDIDEIYTQMTAVLANLNKLAPENLDDSKENPNNSDYVYSSLKWGTAYQNYVNWRDEAITINTKIGAVVAVYGAIVLVVWIRNAITDRKEYWEYNYKIILKIINNEV